jgi:hypothetical protein
VGGGLGLSGNNVGTIFMDSTSLPCSNDDEWLDSPPVWGDDSHEGGILVSFVLDG